MTSNHIGRSYDYRAICDVCGFKKWNYELRKRWDGLMCCAEDWEPRNFLDFYRTRNDAHRLPFTRPDDTIGNLWVPTVTGVTGTYTNQSSYLWNPVTKLFVGTINLIPATSLTYTNSTFTLPNSLTTATSKGGTVRDCKNGVFYSSITVAFVTTKLHLTGTVTSSDIINITGSCITS